MASLQAALETGRQALQARQLQLGVKGSNLANADRVSFHRQQAVVQARPALATSYGEIGTGVQVIQVVRAYNATLESSLRSATQEYSFQDTRLHALQAIEDRLAPSGTAPLADAMSAFVGDVQAAAASPTSRELRVAVLASARTLASQFQRDRQGLTALRSLVTASAGAGSLGGTVSQVNDLAAQVADLNRRIVATEATRFGAQPANDLRDTRDELLGQLAGLAAVEAAEEANGAYTIRLGGELLVGQQTSRQLAYAVSSGGPAITWADSGATATTDGGELGGLLASAQELTAICDDLDLAAAALVTQANNVLAGGFDLLGNAGAPLFGGNSASTLAVTLTDVNKLAFSATAGATANGSQAEALVSALETPLDDLGGRSLAGFPDAWVNAVAYSVAAANQGAKVAQATQQMYAQAVSDYSGVSVDEEMIDMLEVQRAYQATAKYVAAIDAMLEQALAIVR